MKTLPIRCREGDVRKIRAIAYVAENTGKPTNPNEPPPRDSCPTHKFFQEAKAKCPESWADLLVVIDETARFGPPKNTQKFNSLSKGLFEFKSWQLRLICFFDEADIIICTHGFVKKQQETPKHEKEIAHAMHKAYKEAKKRGEVLHVQPKY